MAKNDYYRLVYIVLRHLYNGLLAGVGLDENSQAHKPADISDEYWAYIIEGLLLDGYITGPSVVPVWGGQKIILGMEDAKITPKGIEYLQENSAMKRVMAALKAAKEIIPGI